MLKIRLLLLPVSLSFCFFSLAGIANAAGKHDVSKDYKTYWQNVTFNQNVIIPINKTCKLDENTLRTEKPVSVCKKSAPEYLECTGGAEGSENCRVLAPGEQAYGYVVERTVCVETEKQHFSVSRKGSYLACDQLTLVPGYSGEGDLNTACAHETSISFEYPLHAKAPIYYPQKGKDGIPADIFIGYAELDIPQCKN